MHEDHHADPWGPYRSAITEQFASCHDYLTRLQRSLAGQIAPDRHYFNSKAAALADAARRLQRLGQDIERWLDACDHPMTIQDPDAVYTTPCTRPARHSGPHDDHDSPVEGAITAARDLADRADGMARRVGWTALSIDQDTTRGQRVDPDDRADLDDATATLDAIAHDARTLTGRLNDIGRHARAQPVDARLDQLQPRPPADRGLGF